MLQWSALIDIIISVCHTELLTLCFDVFSCIGRNVVFAFLGSFFGSSPEIIINRHFRYNNFSHIIWQQKLFQQSLI